MNITNRKLGLGLLWGAAALYVLMTMFLPAGSNTAWFYVAHASFVVGIIVYARAIFLSTHSSQAMVRRTTLVAGGIALLTVIATTFLAFSAA